MVEAAVAAQIGNETCESSSRAVRQTGNEWKGDGKELEIKH
jgi:hypothetical protein